MIDKLVSIQRFLLFFKVCALFLMALTVKYILITSHFRDHRSVCKNSFFVLIILLLNYQMGPQHQRQKEEEQEG